MLVCSVKKTTLIFSFGDTVMMMHAPLLQSSSYFISLRSIRDDGRERGKSYQERLFMEMQTHLQLLLLTATILRYIVKIQEINEPMQCYNVFLISGQPIWPWWVVDAFCVFCTANDDGGKSWWVTTNITAAQQTPHDVVPFLYIFSCIWLSAFV